MRRFLAGTVLILMLLCGRYISRAAKSITKSDYKDMICAGGQWLVEAIWNQAHPAENAGMSGSWPDAWEAPGLSMTRILLTVNTTRLKHFMKNTSILPGTAMNQPADTGDRESWPRGSRAAGRRRKLLRRETVRGGGAGGAGGAKTESSQDLAAGAGGTATSGYQGQTSPWRP